MTSTLVLVEYTKKRFYMACVSGDKIAYAKKNSRKLQNGWWDLWTVYKNYKQDFELEPSSYSFGEEFIIAWVEGQVHSTLFMEGGDEDFWDGAKEGMTEYLRKKY